MGFGMRLGLLPRLLGLHIHPLHTFSCTRSFTHPLLQLLYLPIYQVEQRPQVLVGHADVASAIVITKNVLGLPLAKL